ncbi:hypothetical protein RA876_08885 [Rhodoferax antarcticus]|nr:hypothetical protein RA876_08885 [Rhodoferax antarcticus]
MHILYIGLCALLLAGCALPAMPDRAVSHALEPAQAAQTSLGQSAAPQLLLHPGQSGIHPLSDPLAAFAARMLLAHTAGRSLDVQYYIWRGDQSGTLLLQALVGAADRGVRVRLLLDVGGTSGLDGMLAALALHPQIEVRLFNPFVVRKPKPLGYLTDFGRANRRMHNKSFTADNQATIVGGRNVGDEYFGATDGVLFSDLDVLVVGAVVPEVSHNFDRHWASASAYPAQVIVSAVGPAELQALGTEATRVEASDATQAYMQAVRDTPFIQHLLEQKLNMEWSRTTLVSDDPLKGLGQAKRAGLLVHAGYAKHRKAMLQHGAELHEMQRLAPPSRHARLNPLGSSGSSLHAKTFAADGTHAFVGSFNFDPRSALLTTELGVVIDNPRLARQIEQAFETQIPGQSCRVQLSESGELEWQSGQDGTETPPTIYSVEPGSSWLSRWGMRVLALLTIDRLL